MPYITTIFVIKYLIKIWIVIWGWFICFYLFFNTIKGIRKKINDLINQKRNYSKKIQEKNNIIEKNNKNDNIKLCFEFDQKFNEFLKGKNDRINKLKNKYKLTISKNDINEINEAGDIDDYNTKGFQISKSFVSEL